MILGHTSVELFYLLGVGIVILGAALAFGIMRTRRLSRRERERLDENTRLAQRRDDPQKTSP
jgi:hypothetical protein